MKKLILYIVLAALVSAFFAGCGQTDEDLVQMESILGNWQPLDSNGDIIIDVPLYTFETDNNGSSKLLNTTDTFKWEIRRGQLKIYYETAPSYYIGYDRYNSRSLMKILEVNQNTFKVTQFYSDGFQREITFHRYDIDEWE